MSNVIKSRYVYVNGEDKKIIDSNGNSEKFKVIHFNKQLSEIPYEDEIAVSDNRDDTFVAGLAATVIDKVLLENEEKYLQQQREQIISDAQMQAKQIIENAEIDAKKSSELLYEEANKTGYEAGLQKGMSQVKLAQKELEELSQKQNMEYLEQINTLEPHFANIVSALIEKITGIVVEDKKEVILYLIHNAMINADNSKSYSIKVSKDDYEFVLSRKVELSSFLNNETTLEVVFDRDLDKNQCMIVTDTRIIDCSLDVQLSNLIQDIKLLSK